MSYVTLPGQGLILPDRPLFTNPALGFATAVIDATGEKVAFIGHVFNKDRTSKDITKIGFRPGTVVSAGGSGITLSLQNVDTTAGPPGRPDGTQDQTVGFLLSALTSSTYYHSAALSANRTVAFGELVAVVFEYDVSGRLGADSLQISGMTQQFTGSPIGPITSLYAGAAWSLQTMLPNVVFEFTDGTFGTLKGSYPVSGSATISDWKSDSTPDERALRFQVAHKCKIDGGWISAYAATGCNFDVVLYNGTTQMASVSIDQNIMGAVGISYLTFAFDAEYELLPGNTYYLSMKPTTVTSGVNLAHISVNANGHFQAHQGGVEFYAASRTDAGAWTDVTTNRPVMGICISSVDDGAGGSGPVGQARIIQNIGTY